jgi:type II secretory pathway pseudopilin PulG
MTRRCRKPSAFALVEVLVVAALGLILGDLLVNVMVQVQRLQHGAVMHADRMAVADGLTDTMRRDALAARRHECGPKVESSEGPLSHELSLETWTPAGPNRVAYRISPDRVVRTEDGAETHAWQARRLEFNSWLERGPHGDVLWLDFTEQPDAAAARRLPRTFSWPLLLPTLPEAAP